MAGAGEGASAGGVVGVDVGRRSGDGADAGNQEAAGAGRRKREKSEPDGDGRIGAQAVEEALAGAIVVLWRRDPSEVLGGTAGTLREHAVETERERGGIGDIPGIGCTGGLQGHEGSPLPPAGQPGSEW